MRVAIGEIKFCARRRRLLTVPHLAAIDAPNDDDRPVRREHDCSSERDERASTSRSLTALTRCASLRATVDSFVNRSQRERRVSRGEIILRVVVRVVVRGVSRRR